MNKKLTKEDIADIYNGYRIKGMTKQEAIDKALGELYDYKKVLEKYKIDNDELLEKVLKALSMICDYDVTPSDILMCKDYDAYMFKRDYQEGWTLSKEQFDFLKEALEYE